MKERRAEQVAWKRRRVEVAGGGRRVVVEPWIFKRGEALLAALHAWAPAGAESGYGAFASRPGVRVKGKGFLGLVVVSAALAGSWWLVRGSAVGELTVFFLGMLLVPAVGVLAVLDFWRWRRRREGIALALALGAVVLWGCALRERWGFSLEAGRPFVVELGRGAGGMG